MPGKPHGWAHDRAKHIRKKNPDLPEGAEYGIAQLQEVAVGKEKEHGGKVKPSTKTKAKKKYKKPKSQYEQKAAPKSKSKKKKSKKKAATMNDLIKLIVDASNHFDSVGEIELANKLDKIGTQIALRTAEKDEDDGEESDHLELRDHTCGCEEEPTDSNDNGICDGCGLVYKEECGCGETDMTGYCLGCSSTQPLMRIMVISDDPLEDSVIAHFNAEGKLIRVAGKAAETIGAGAGAGLGYMAGKAGGGAAGAALGTMLMPGIGTAVGAGLGSMLGGAGGAAAGGAAGQAAGGAISSASKRKEFAKYAQEIVKHAEALDVLNKDSSHLDAILEKLAEASEEKPSEGECCDSKCDRNGNGICDNCGDVCVDGCACGSTHVVGRCNKCGAGNLLQRRHKSELFKTGGEDDGEDETKVALILPKNSQIIKEGQLPKEAGMIGGAAGGLIGGVMGGPIGSAVGGMAGNMLTG